MSHKLATSNCFWPTGCADMGRCNSEGFCIAQWQADHKHEIWPVKNGGISPSMPTSIGNPNSDWMPNSSHDHGNCELCDELEKRAEMQFKKDQEARLTLTERAIAAESQLEQVRSELALAMRLMGNWREFPPSRVLAVGEPCVGGWIGRDKWSCRCGAKIPEQCKTETEKP